jgi:hypothetical protein
VCQSLFSVEVRVPELLLDLHAGCFSPAAINFIFHSDFSAPPAVACLCGRELVSGVWPRSSFPKIDVCGLFVFVFG